MVLHKEPPHARMQITPFDSNKTYYVIIGCGFSAILNHVQLVSSAATRIQGLTILHIGLNDPWFHYRSMSMGQWPGLLSLPGYTVPAADPYGTVPLNSKIFANRNQLQWAQLGVTHPSSHRSGTVTAIIQSGNSFLVRLDTNEDIKAAYIDICGGLGPPRNPSSKIAVDATLQTEFETRSSATGSWPRLTSGEGFLMETENRCSPGSKVCVYGGGPTAAWCVESAQNDGCEVVWLARQSVNDAFVASGRNDHLVAEMITRTNVNGNHVVTGDLTPRKSSTTFGEHVQVIALVGLDGHQVEVTTDPLPGKTPRWVGAAGPIASFVTEKFDQVICAIGQQQHPKDRQSWAAMVRTYIVEAKRHKQHVIRDADGRAVGLKNLEETLRVLGAAALGHRDIEKEWNNTDTPSYSYYRSLVEQARVPVGIVLAANSVSAANNFVLSGRAPNVNTCSLTELESQLGWLVPDLPATIFSTRGVRTIPYTEKELYGTNYGLWSYFL